MPTIIESMNERISLIEKAISESIINHNGLLARMEEAKHFLDMAIKTAEAVVPDSMVTECLEVIDKAIDSVDEIIPAE